MRRFGPAPLAVGVALSLAAAACTTEQQSDPRPALSSTTSTTTTLAPESPTTTTTPPETTETPTTEIPPTTLPAGPADAVVAVLTGGASGGWLFLGNWQSTRWANAVDDGGNPVSPTIEAGTQIVVTNLDGEKPATFGASVESCFDGRTGPTVDVAVAAPDPPGFGYSAIAVSQVAWPMKPRPVAETTGAPDSYRALGAAVFAASAVDATLGAVEQLVVTDLDGDGDDEALVSFEYIQPGGSPGTPGDLSALLLVDTATTASSTVLEAHVPTDLADSGFGVIERSRVIDIADFNGDGRTEVVVHSWYYEGASVGIYEYDGTILTEVLTAGCGA